MREYAKPQSLRVGEAEYAVQHMPASVEQIFSDLGDEVYHGGARFRSCAPVENPCRQVSSTRGSQWMLLLRSSLLPPCLVALSTYHAYVQAYMDHSWGQDASTLVSSTLVDLYGFPPGRQSWDPLAVLIAVRTLKTWSTVRRHTGWCRVSISPFAISRRRSLACTRRHGESMELRLSKIRVAATIASTLEVRWKVLELLMDALVSM